MHNPVILFIVEGESRDYRFINEMTQRFFKGRYSSTIINLPASQNLYMLFQKLEEDDFETDIVEILRDTVEEARIKLDGIKRQEIEEVFLFFDYDVHQNNMSHGAETMTKMLRIFNNETENGKLYISYPMVEALYDYREGECAAFSNCFVDIDNSGKYKGISGYHNPHASQKISIQHWREILNAFFLRTQCLLAKDDLTYQWYKAYVAPEAIFSAEKKLGELHHSIFILSAFPEFLFDYFKEDFWNTMTHRKKRSNAICPKQ